MLGKINSIQQLTLIECLLAGQSCADPKKKTDKQDKISDPEDFKSSQRMRRASHLNYLSPQVSDAQSMTEPLLGPNLSLGMKAWPGPSPAGQHWSWQGENDWQEKAHVYLLPPSLPRDSPQELFSLEGFFPLPVRN